VGSGVGGVAGVAVGAFAAGRGVAVGALAAVTRGVTAGVGESVAAGVVVVFRLARTGGRARPALRTASAATAPISATSKRLLRTCHSVSCRRPPLDRNGRPHQSHSVDPDGFFPPQPGQTTIGSSAAGTAGHFYTKGLLRRCLQIQRITV
jgi:hypothetical protein